MSADATVALARIVELLQRGDATAALALAVQVSAAHPVDAETARLHGVALLMLGRSAEARMTFEHALQLAPDHPEILSNLASALLADGDAERAVVLLHAASATHPHHCALHNNLANALRAAGDDERARSEYLAALALEPQHLGATLNLAATEISLGLVSDAEARLRGLLARQPHPQAWLLLGHALHRTLRYAEAESAYARGAQLAPAAAEFAYQQALMADEQQHYPQAVRMYRHALQLDPNMQLAESQLLFVLRRECDWLGAAALAPRIKARALDGSGDIDPFVFLAEDATPAEQLACARARAANVARAARPLQQRMHFTHAARDPRAPLRVGFVSAGLHAHATALLVVAMFEALARIADVECHLYATTPDDGSEVRQRLRHAVQALHELASQPAATIARRIHADRIDVLVDVDGWCAGGSPGVFALRPAPVQAGWLAYPGTSGADDMDWLIADDYIIPDASRVFYSESIACLPRCYQPSDTTRRFGAPPPRAAFGLPAGATVFASFNNAWKLNAASFARMCAVLREVPGSVLWLLDAGTDADARLRAAAHAQAVEPTRLVFAPAVAHFDHLARLQHADLILDSNPYNAHTTASDAIWAGCPVLTRPGETFAARVAGSINHHLGMPELIAADDAAFIATAVQLGNDRAALAHCRARLAGLRQTSGLFDMHAYAHDFAALLHAIAVGGALDCSRAHPM